ncbi:hypothetical protein LUZ61_003180 [Rhynchospora tenuis]|uniref:Exopolygalacturonase n=1 Tax=Rhynchospora tenuis TaxID=198213 RepID=A0AAD6ESK7_9POAL|nr:hypothetical protein LUZ61_003180 [Rhynchospora tenuis]
MAKATLGDVFDVTKYSASTGGSPSDNSKAFLNAWKAACDSDGNATFLVPKGTFQLGQVKFVGPCSSGTPRVQFSGELHAPANLESISDEAWIDFEDLNGLVVAGGGVIHGQGADAWSKDSDNKPVSLRFMKITTGTISDLTLKDSKFFHISIHQSQSITIDRLKISAPGDSKNTDGIHISASNNITLTSLNIGTGDDCVSIGQGSVNITVSDVMCGPGHGLSIGSLGKDKDEENVAHVTVKNCSVTGTTNGLRIKTWGGSPPSEAFNIRFEDIFLSNVSNPIIIDQAYCPGDDCSKEPSQVKISDVTFKNIHGTSNTPVAVELQCSEAVPCKNINLDQINLQPLTSIVSNISSVCSNVLVPPLPSTIIPKPHPAYSTRSHFPLPTSAPKPKPKPA